MGAPLTGGAATADRIATQGASLAASIALPLAGFGGPVGIAVAGAIAIAGQIANLFGGCGQTCVQATAIVNQAEPLLQQNLQNYLAASPHYASLQALHLNNFDTVWAAVQQACSTPSLGTAGQKCISDRQAGACHYQTSPGGWSNGVYTYPGLNGSGTACWNWFVGYRDPIASDPTVVPDPNPISQAGSSILSSLGISNGSVGGIQLTDLLLPGALILAALLIPSDD